MTQLTTNNTPRAREAAALISNRCHESHRGAMRYRPADTCGTFCIALFGNEGYTKRPDSAPVSHARMKAYVHNCYAGLVSLLPEGEVEFGTDEHSSTWVILAHFHRHDAHGDYDDEELNDALVDFWNDIVGEQWRSQLAYTQE